MLTEGRKIFMTTVSEVEPMAARINCNCRMRARMSAFVFIVEGIFFIATGKGGGFIINVLEVGEEPRDGIDSGWPAPTDLRKLPPCRRTDSVWTRVARMLSWTVWLPLAMLFSAGLFGA